MTEQCPKYVHQKIACLGYESLIHTFLIIHNNSVLLRAKLARNQSDNQVLSYLPFLPIMPIAHFQNMSELVPRFLRPCYSIACCAHIWQNQRHLRLYFAPPNSNMQQGRNWRVGRVGNCSPRFWQNRRRRQEAGAARAPHYILLANPDLRSQLRPCVVIFLSDSI